MGKTSKKAPTVGGGKAKLRPARDVISRLRWEEPATASGRGVAFGYLDRINGTMEKAVEDYVPMADGGDIPEHRILYFRRLEDDDLREGIIWDRAGRVDRVFGSGHCGEAVSDETVEEARAAIGNMARLEEEKAERREQKARDRVRRARAKATQRRVTSAVVAENAGDNTAVGESGDRFLWKSFPWHHFDGRTGQWRSGSKLSTQHDVHNKDLAVLTWNVLSDIHPIKVSADGNEAESHESRWSVLIESIREKSPDIVALQEATPRFADQLLETGWVRDGYDASISPDDKVSVSPIGQVLLWKQSRVQASAMHVCVDGGRHRAITGIFRFGNKTILCANVHLPADKPSPVAGEKISRQIARRRELNSIIGHMQNSEAGLKRQVDHLVLGDFNCLAPELEDNSFAGNRGFFKDIFSLLPCSAAGSGDTFCPKTNPRAAWSTCSSGSGNMDGRRIDRLYLNSSSELEHAEVDVVHGKKSGDELPPSDHYGVFAKLDSASTDVRRKGVKASRALHNAWAASALPSKDFMLALLLDSEALERIKIEDRSSSLLQPHVTLLYGFVEVLNRDSLNLACGAVRESIREAFQEQTHQLQTISFAEDSLDVFEHRSSATLVAKPNSGWLMQLYDSLRSRFRLCTDQEMHSSEGFQPHVTLGSFGMACTAREVAAECAAAVSGLTIPIRSVDILERGSNGKFRSIASVPFPSPPKYRGLGDVISDTGREASSFFSRKCEVVISKIACASRKASRSYYGLSIASEVVPYGSLALGCALPKMSDLDVAVIICPGNRDVSLSQLNALAKDCSYLKKVMAFLAGSSTAKMRLRQLRSGLTVLTIDIRGFPSADILLCVLGHDGKPSESKVHGAMKSLQDNKCITDVLADLKVYSNSEQRRNDFSVEDVYEASLRLIKLWAYNRAVYSAKGGFLGGGAWAIFLAHVMRKLEDDETVFAGAQSLAEAAHIMTLAFFEEAARWPWPQPVALSDAGVGNQDAQQQSRLVVLAPSSTSNLAKNSTASTCLATAAELRRASVLARGTSNDGDKANIIIGALESIMVPLQPRDLISSSNQIIALELVNENDRQSLTSPHLPGDIEAWGYAQCLSFLVNLEKKLGGAQVLRPYSRAIKVWHEWSVPTKQDGFVWIIGVSGDISKEEREAVREISFRMAQCSGISGLQLSASVLSSEDALQRIEHHKCK